MKIITISNYPGTISTTFYAAIQSVASGANFVLNYDSQFVNQNNVVSTPGWAMQVTFTAAGANTANVLLVGRDELGTIVTETLAAASTNTVVSVNRYATLISATASAAITSMSIGHSGLANSVPFKMNTDCVKMQWAVQTLITGTMTYSLQYTLFPFENYTNSPTFTDVSADWITTAIAAPGGDGTVTLTGKTANFYWNYEAMVYAIRFQVTAETSGATFVGIIGQQGTI